MDREQADKLLRAAETKHAAALTAANIALGFDLAIIAFLSGSTAKDIQR
jgi:hypothetical protein